MPGFDPGAGHTRDGASGAGLMSAYPGASRSARKAPPESTAAAGVERHVASRRQDMRVTRPIRQAFWKAACATVDRVNLAVGRTRGLSILIYHGVSEQPEVLGHFDVDRDRFERQLQLLAEAFVILPLGEAVRRLHDGSLPARAACITFDDGYANNHEVALPILERYGLTATFFVATGYLDGGWMFNDVIIDSVRRCEARTLDLQAQRIGVFDLANDAARVAAVSRIISALKYLPSEERSERAEEVRELCGVAKRPSLMMTSEQVHDLSRRGMEIGGHTHLHPILSCEPDDVARREIETGKQRLEELTDKQVRVFAYPNGQPGRDYDARHVDMVRQSGFDVALSTRPGCASAANDVLELPRFTPWDRNPDKFMGRLALSRMKSTTVHPA